MIIMKNKMLYCNMNVLLVPQSELNNFFLRVVSLLESVVVIEGNVRECDIWKGSLKLRGIKIMLRKL